MTREEIKELRLKTGLTQKQLAALMPCVEMCVSKWERGVTHITKLYEIRLRQIGAMTEAQIKEELSKLEVKS